MKITKPINFRVQGAWRSRLTRAPALLLALALAGCAGERAHQEGLDLIEVGRLEEGLSKLEQATREAPENLSFRTDLLDHRDQMIHRMLIAADNERAIGRPDEAEVLYERVLVLDRQNPRAKAGMEAVAMDRRHARLLAQAQEANKKGDLDTAAATLQGILREDPDKAEAKALLRQIEEQLAKSAMASPSLRSKFKQPVSLQFRDANLKMVFEALSRTSGINVLLDKDVRPDLKTTIFVKDVSVQDTIDLILMQNQLEKKVLSDNTVFVYPDTPAKLKDYQDLKIRTFHFVNAEAKQMMTLIKTVLKTKDLFLDEKSNSVVMRDTPDAVRLAEKLVAAQDLADPEVELDVEVLEVSRARLSQLGIKWPDQVTFSVTGSTTQQNSTTTTSGGAVVSSPTLFTTPLTVERLRHINGSGITVSPLSVGVDLKGEDSDSNLLASPRIRVRDKEKAKILVGDRVPVITNSVTPVSGGTSVVTGNVQYLDVGLKLEVEPQIHQDSDVGIKINLEVSSIVKEITSSSGSLAYQIGTRNASTNLRLKDGETQVLAGLINDNDRKAVQKIPGLGDLPILGRLFSSHRNSKDKTEIILSITPHIIRNVLRPDAELTEFWSGTESALRTKPLTLEPAGKVSLESGGPATPPGARPRPTIPGPAQPRPGTTAPVPPPAPAPPPQPGAAPSPAPTPAPAAPAPPKTPAASEKVLLNWQGPTRAKIGEEFNVTLYARIPQGTGSFPFLIGFDPAVLKAVRVNEGELSKQGATLTSQVDDASGQIALQLSAADAGVTAGRGSLVSVTFVATAANPKTQVTVAQGNPVTSTGDALSVVTPGPHNITLTP